MSRYHFNSKWKETLSLLDNLIELDLEYQKTKINDQKRCHAAQRLSGILGKYISIYNDALDCAQHNLQPQKNKHMREIVNSLLTRILELKQQLKKLESSNTQFLGQGLIDHKLTTYNVELTELPNFMRRSPDVTRIINDVFQRVKDQKPVLAEKVKEAEEENKKEIVEKHWWDGEVNDNDTNSEADLESIEELISEEALNKRNFVTLIQAHERSRKVILIFTQQRQKREKWRKELEGTLHSQARYEVRERAAKLIQTVCRAYFELKRKKVHDCKLDQLLEIRLCKKRSRQAQAENKEIKIMFMELNKKYENEWISMCEKIKHDYLKKHGEAIAEDFRDLIRDWFQKWYDEVKYFYNIPNEKEGGSALIFKEEVPSPVDWLEEYKIFMSEKKANKNKTAMEMKWEIMQAKREEIKAIKEELMKKKLEDAFKKKLMKNPTLHPGFNYPESKKTKHILTAIENYRKNWIETDIKEQLDFKQRDVDEICRDIKLEILQTIEEDMRIELKALRKSLTMDYKRTGEQMPEDLKKPPKLKKKKTPLNITLKENIAEKMVDLAMKGILQEYPKTNLEDFWGDHNYAGDELRCMYTQVLPFAGETRHIWWERCEEVSRGFQRILLAGPNGSRKTVLVHALATVNDATLFQIDPAILQNQILSYFPLQDLVNSLTLCAQYAQPSVIYIKNVHLFYEGKVSSEDAYLWNQMKRQLLRKLIKKIRKWDKITLIGTCTDPWLIKTKQMLKQFPTVILAPPTSYSMTLSIVQEWFINNRLFLSNLDVQSLAYMLQGYSFRFIQKTLENFWTPDRIIHVAAHGLFTEDVYNFFIDNCEENKVTYDKYWNWYSQNTYWGKTETKRLVEQTEFLELQKKYEEKMKKKSKSQLTTVFLHSSVTGVNDNE